MQYCRDKHILAALIFIPIIGKVNIADKSLLSRIRFHVLETALN